MGAMSQRGAVAYELVIQDDSAGIGRVGEQTDVLSINGKGDVGSRSGIGEGIWKYTEHVHCGSSEAYSYRHRVFRIVIGGVVPGLLVDSGEVQYRRAYVAVTVLGGGTLMPLGRGAVW